MFIPAPATESCDQQHGPYANVSGGRLIFTNLRDRGAFPAAAGSTSIPDVELPYEVVQDPAVPLSAAAALNANFPPVFTNARVDVLAAEPDIHCPMRSYYVTDGGATENLGLVSALYALHRALQGFQPEDRGSVPEMHLMLLEASATTYDYTPDRGINAASGGSKERLTGGLTLALLEQVGLELDRIGVPRNALEIHYLAMPLAFRSRGGFGTHWMFPQSIEIENPRTPHPARAASLSPWWQPADQRASRRLNRCELMNLWTQLHDPVRPFCGSTSDSRDAPMQEVAAWICGSVRLPPLRPDQQIEQWQAVIESFRRWRPASADTPTPEPSCTVNGAQ